LVQVFVLLLALTPLFLEQHSLGRVLGMLALSIVPAAGVGVLAAFELRRRLG
jgi:hypothetical protein